MSEKQNKQEELINVAIDDETLAAIAGGMKPSKNQYWEVTCMDCKNRIEIEMGSDWIFEVIRKCHHCGSKRIQLLTKNR